MGLHSYHVFGDPVCRTAHRVCAWQAAGGMEQPTCHRLGVNATTARALPYFPAPCRFTITLFSHVYENN
jgi:hypothetical protein